MAESTPTTPDATVRCPMVPTPAPRARINVPMRNEQTRRRGPGRCAPVQSAQTVRMAPARAPRRVMISRGGKDASAAFVAAGEEPKQTYVPISARMILPQLAAVRNRSYRGRDDLADGAVWDGRDAERVDMPSVTLQAVMRGDHTFAMSCRDTTASRMQANTTAGI